jgi:hypothetical protein
MTTKEKGILKPAFVKKAVSQAIRALKPQWKKLKDLEDRELVSEYASAVRLTWGTHQSSKPRPVHAGHNPDFQRELSLKREILRRLERVK